MVNFTRTILWTLYPKPGVFCASQTLGVIDSKIGTLTENRYDMNYDRLKQADMLYADIKERKGASI